MNSKFKSFMALSLAVLFASVDARTVQHDEIPVYQEKTEQTSYFGTKSKVALAILGAAGAYVGYKAYTNPEAFKQSVKNAYSACTLENVKAVPGMAQKVAMDGAAKTKALALAGYNACTKENAQAVLTSAQDKAVAFKNMTVEGAKNAYNACTLDNVKVGYTSAKDAVVSNVTSFYAWAKSFVVAKPEAVQELAELSSVTTDAFGAILK